MRVCIVGAGAIGGYIAARMEAGGNEVSMIARGETLAAIRARGLRLETGGETVTATPEATDDPHALGPQDAVVLAVKAPALGAVVPLLGPLLGPETPVVAAMNGIPWWFFEGFGAHAGTRLQACDPDWTLARALPATRVLGCVVHCACSVPEPGVVLHHDQNRFLIGEAGGATSPRAGAVVDAMRTGGLGAEIAADIRAEVWLKLLGNLNFGPVSLLTGATNDRMRNDPGLRRLCIAMFDEADRVGRHYGLAAGMSGAERVALGGRAVGFKTSMRQDFERGRPVELDAIVAAPMEMGDIAGIETPIIDAVFALAAAAAEAAGCYTAR